MKKVISLTLMFVVVFIMIISLSSCGSDKIEESFLFDYLEGGLLDKTVDEIKSIDANADKFGYKEKEKEGYWRLNYTYKFEDGTGDAFVPESGRWITQVKYFFHKNDKTLHHMEIRYMQTDFSQGMCNKRISLFKKYLNEKYGEGITTEAGTKWKIGNAQLEMAKQNGGWILFTYKEYVEPVVTTSINMETTLPAYNFSK